MQTKELPFLIEAKKQTEALELEKKQIDIELQKVMQKISEFNKKHSQQ